MKTRFVSITLSRNETYPLTPVVLEIAFTCLSTMDGTLTSQKGVSGLSIEELHYVEVYRKTLRSESYEGLADGVRAILREVLSVLEKNGYYFRENPISIGDYLWFNTGNDTKLVGEFVNFLLGIQDNPEAAVQQSTF